MNNPRNWNTLITDMKDEACIIISNISAKNGAQNAIIGYPQNAYPYGSLMTFIPHGNYYTTSQIYIPHNTDYFFVRTLADGVGESGETRIGIRWRKISCAFVDSVS